MTTKNVKAIENVVRVLDAVLAAKRSVGVRELAAELGLTVPSVHRICATMESSGLLEHPMHEDRYQPGIKLVEIAARTLSSLDVRQAARAEMEELSSRVNLTVSLSVYGGLHRVPIEQIVTQGPASVSVALGIPQPLTRGAPSRAILAFMQPEAIDRAIQNDESLRRSAARKVALQDLDHIRQVGFAESSQELVLGVAALAAPLFDHNRQVIGSIALVGPIAKQASANSQEHVSLLRSASMRISARLGFETEGSES